MKKFKRPKLFLNSYSTLENAFRPDWSRWRGKYFDQLLAYLHHRHVTANHITALGTALGVTGALALWLGWMPVALVLLILHLLGDALDGPLAKFTQTDSNRGGFTDVCADQAVVIAVVFALLAGDRLPPLAGSFFILGHTIIVGFALVRNAMGIPYNWLIHPRIFLYVGIFLEYYLWPETLIYLIYIFNGIFALRILSGFLRIRKEL